MYDPTEPESTRVQPAPVSIASFNGMPGREREGGYEIYFDGLFPVVFTSQPINGGSSAAIPTISSSPMIRFRSGSYTLYFKLKRGASRPSNIYGVALSCIPEPYQYNSKYRALHG